MMQGIIIIIGIIGLVLLARSPIFWLVVGFLFVAVISVTVSKKRKEAQEALRQRLTEERERDNKTQRQLSRYATAPPGRPTPIGAESLEIYTTQTDTRCLLPNARDALFEFLGHGKCAEVIVLDVETNGLAAPSSVLSLAAIRYALDMKSFTLAEHGRFLRYYYPKEPYNPKAIAVNRLDREEILRRRGSCSYPENFSEDKDFYAFASGVKHFISHNVDFDSRFIPIMKEGKTFCTMRANTDIIGLRGFKFPKLSEAANFYQVAFSEDLAHDSMHDTEACSAIFRRMLEAVKSTIGEELLCPYCRVSLEYFPLRAKACPNCGKKIYVLQRPETRRKTLLREDEREELEQAWTRT